MPATVNRTQFFHVGMRGSFNRFDVRSTEKRPDALQYLNVGTDGVLLVIVEGVKPRQVFIGDFDIPRIPLRHPFDYKK
jgi:hypothetical protein